MIPKKIHYCWFGKGEMPELTIKCINSWKKHLPEYELVLWNEDNFDINMNQYVKEAYEAKKYAFVSDYVRLYALYNYGGIYMDTDVEVIKSMDIFLKHRAFIGCESESWCGTGTIGAEKEHKWIKDLLLYYNDKSFILPSGKYDQTTNVKIVTQITMEKFGWKAADELQMIKEGIYVYPFEVFCAKDLVTGNIAIKSGTYTIHHFSGSWFTGLDKLKQKIIQIIGPNFAKKLIDIKHKIS